MPVLTPEEKSLYDVPLMQVFAKNFVVGFARSLGGLAVQVVFLGLFYFTVVQFILPKLQPLFTIFQSTQNSLQGLQKRSNPLNIFSPEDKLDLDTPEKTR